MTSDRRIRELERQALLGDAEARRVLRRLLGRRGQLAVDQLGYLAFQDALAGTTEVNPFDRGSRDAVLWEQGYTRAFIDWFDDAPLTD